MHLAYCGLSFYFDTRLGEPLRASCSLWIITLVGYKAS